MSGKQDKNGFSGLSNLVSEISDLDNQINSEVKTEIESTTFEQQTQSEWESTNPDADRKSENSSRPDEISDRDKGVSRSNGKVMLGILGVFIVLWLAYSEDQTSNKAASNTSLPQANNDSISLPQTNSTPLIVPKTNNDSLNSQNIQLDTTGNQQNTDLIYTIPPIGTNNVLSELEIRWCIREGIRIDAMRNIINTNEGVDAFNRIVTDSNSRCGSFRYRNDALSRAESYVQAFRREIEAQAIIEAKQFGSSQPSPPPTSTSKTDSSRQDIREAQQLLIELGYKLGAADGNYGNRTVKAVKAFQRDNGIQQDGVINQSLLSTLKKIRDIHSKKDSNTTSFVIPNTSGQKDITSKLTVTASEKAKIKKHCSLITNTSGDEYNCISSELINLKQSGGMPDLSGITKSERAKIKSHCSLITSTPGDEYNCISSELISIKQSGGMPDLSGITKSEKAKIQSHCSLITSTPGDEYNCISSELLTLKQSGGMPDLSGITNSERTKIKAHCSLIASTPGAEYNCISTELINIKLSGGMPDLSGISKSERARIKEHCSLITSTPGDEYICLRSEQRKLRFGLN